MSRIVDEPYFTHSAYSAFTTGIQVKCPKCHGAGVVTADDDMVESFPFPAPFEKQQYIGDEGKIHVYSWDGRQETNLVGPYSVRDLYLEHFGK